MTRFCVGCGASIPQAAGFCPQCGQTAPRGFGGTVLMDQNSGAAPAQPQAPPVAPAQAAPVAPPPAAPGMMPPGAPQPGWQGGAMPGAPAAAPPWQAGVGAFAAGAAAAAMPGAQPPAQHVAPPLVPEHGPPIPLCPSCGAIAPSQRTTCAVCDASLAQQLVARDGADGFWVGVECGFTCSACGHVSPLNYLDNDGDVQCLRCGTEQRFDSDQWWESLALAHAVGDLAGPAPEGRFPLPGASIADENMFKPIGVDKTFADHQQRGMIIDGSGMRQHSLKVRAMPGHPLCEKCKQPRRVTACAGGELTLQCPACADTRTYLRPNGIPDSLSALSGVVAMDHEKGGRHADVQQDASGAVAIRCPNCSAPLDFDGKSTVIRCKFCEIAVRIPSHTLRGLGQETPQQLRWWLYFTGVSEMRKELTNKAGASGNRHASDPDAAFQQLMGSSSSPSASPSSGVSAGAGYQPYSATKRSGNSGAMVSMMMGIGMVAVSAGVFFAMSSSHDSSSSHSHSSAIATSTLAAHQAQLKARTRALQDKLKGSSGPTIAVEWQGRVTKASGVQVRPGQKCHINAQVQGPRVRSLAIRCGTQSIYDSHMRANGMMSINYHVAEAPADNAPGSFTYAFKYSITGQFTGRPQVSIDTFVGQGVVFSNVPPMMRVEMKLPAASLPRAGEPIFDTPKSAPHVKWTATVTGATPGAPVKTGASCSLDVAFGNSEAKASVCTATLKCGQRWLYGSRKSPGGGLCKVDGSGTPQTISDTTRASEDHTPIFDYDASNSTASVTSKDDGYTVTLKLSR